MKTWQTQFQASPRRVGRRPLEGSSDTAGTAANGQKLERVLEGESIALTVLTGTRTLTKFLDRTYLGMGYLCGMMFLLLALFITYQVIARKLGWVMAPGEWT